MILERIFDVPILSGTKDELLGRAVALVNSGGTIATVNATMLEYARRNKQFRTTLQNMSLCVPDGMGVVRAFAGRGVRCETLPGVELGLLLPLSRPGLRLALYGAKGGVAKEAGEHILSLAPESELVFACDGYHHTPFEVIREILPLSPDLVYVCLGSPKQEEVVSLISRALPRAVVIGLGGSFDVWSGHKRRAPTSVTKMGLEWLWRMLREPRRFVKLPTLLSFTFHIFWENNHAKLPKNSSKRVKTKK